MQHYSLPELLKLWRVPPGREELTAEQMIAQRAHSAIGQLLLHVTRLSNALSIIEKTMQLPPAPPVIIKRQGPEARS